MIRNNPHKISAELSATKPKIMLSVRMHAPIPPVFPGRPMSAQAEQLAGRRELTHPVFPPR